MKEKTIIKLTIFIIIYCLFMVLGLKNEIFLNYNIFLKIIIVPFLEMFYLTGQNYIIIGNITVILFISLFLPIYPEKIMSSILSHSKNMISILLYGRIVNDNDEDEEFIKEMSDYSPRAYKRWLFYVKEKQVPIIKLFIMPLTCIWTLLIFYFISDFVNNGNFNYSFLWIKDIREVNIPLLIIALLITGIKIIVTFLNKNHIVSKIFSIFIYCCFIPALFKSASSCILIITFFIISMVLKINLKKTIKSLKEGGKNNVKEITKED